MEFAYGLTTGDPLVFKNQINETFSNAGIHVLEVADGTGGVAIGVETSFANAIGVTLDTATYVSAQQSDNSDTERQVSIVVDPMACFRALMSGGGTEGTALALATVTTDTADGKDITTSGTDWSSPSRDEGTAWAYDGVNIGQSRKITGVGATSATLTVPFRYDHVVGDRFLGCPWSKLDNTGKVNTTNALYQADATIAKGTGGDAKIVGLELNDISNDGTTASFVIFNFMNHIVKQLS